jgi:hypothetical protein
VGQGVAEAERERELSKQALAGDVSALGARVRDELDWRSRLQRDGFRYAVIGTAAVLLTVSVVVLRSRRQKKGDEPATVTSLDDVAAQLEEIREELARRRKESGPLWQKLAVRVATTAAAAGGAAVARRGKSGHIHTVEPRRSIGRSQIGHTGRSGTSGRGLGRFAGRRRRRITRPYTPLYTAREAPSGDQGSPRRSWDRTRTVARRAGTDRRCAMARAGRIGPMRSTVSRSWSD